MRIGIIGCGVVGGALRAWLEDFTDHDVLIRDPGLNRMDEFDGVDAVFVSIPVPISKQGQDISGLIDVCAYAKKFTNNIFIRSTVLPGTNDKLGTYSMPEFLTERTSFTDFCEQETVIIGSSDEKVLDLVYEIFEEQKSIEYVSNVEAELIKYTHNCFGAMKVTYFNIIHDLCKSLGADFQEVKKYSMMTGFIEPTHTMVPGPDGEFGFGGKCFPENIETMRNFLLSQPKLIDPLTAYFFQMIRLLNKKFRGNNEKHERNEKLFTSASEGISP